MNIKKVKIQKFKTKLKFILYSILLLNFIINIFFLSCFDQSSSFYGIIILIFNTIFFLFFKLVIYKYFIKLVCGIRNKRIVRKELNNKIHIFHNINWLFLIRYSITNLLELLFNNPIINFIKPIQTIKIIIFIIIFSILIFILDRFLQRRLNKDISLLNNLFFIHCENNLYNLKKNNLYRKDFYRFVFFTELLVFLKFFLIKITSLLITLSFEIMFFSIFFYKLYILYSKIVFSIPILNLMVYFFKLNLNSNFIILNGSVKLKEKNNKIEILNKNNNINFFFNINSIVIIYGKHGSGKTTLLNSFKGYDDKFKIFLNKSNIRNRNKNFISIYKLDEVFLNETLTIMDFFTLNKKIKSICIKNFFNNIEINNFFYGDEFFFLIKNNLFKKIKNFQFSFSQKHILELYRIFIYIHVNSKKNKIVLIDQLIDNINLKTNLYFINYFIKNTNKSFVIFTTHSTMKFDYFKKIFVKEKDRIFFYNIIKN